LPLEDQFAPVLGNAEGSINEWLERSEAVLSRAFGTNREAIFDSDICESDIVDQQIVGVGVAIPMADPVVNYRIVNDIVIAQASTNAGQVLFLETCCCTVAKKVQQEIGARLREVL
jgi:hypothetical protein